MPVMALLALLSPAEAKTRVVASVYWQGTHTATGAKFNPLDLIVAHRTLPFGTKLRITNPKNGKSVVATVADRGPFISGRILDLSLGTAQSIGFSGLGDVDMEVL